MCGIVACSGTKDSQELVIHGLARMQYRGYDSYGFAYLTQQGRLETSKSIESFDVDLIDLPVSQVLLGHTRWATHGVVNLSNSHPHVDAQNSFALVHNGIVDNFASLKVGLVEKGVTFNSTTDTEVILHLMSEALSESNDRIEAMRSLHKKIEGRNTLVILFDDGELLGLCNGSPLIVGQGNDRLYLASDVLAFAAQTRNCFALADGQIVSIKGQDLRLTDQSDDFLQPVWTEADVLAEESGKSGFKHFMLKEILEQWQTIPRQLDADTDELSALLDNIRQANVVLVTGAGGASYAAKQIAWLLRTVSAVRAIDVPAYELSNMQSFVAEGDLILAVSQSGETADTLQAIQTARHWGMKIACLVNMPMSSMTRIADHVSYNRSGPEECVLSTKSASAQITFGYMLANYLIGQHDEVRRHIDELSHQLSLQLTMSQLDQYQSVAAYLSRQDHLFVLGRGKHFATALIGALNIKEASYLHAEAFSAGELKHGVIALIEKGVPVIIFVPDDDTYMLGVAAEVKARGAYVIALTDTSLHFDELFDVVLPLPGNGSLLAAIIPCQLLAYYVATHRGLNPDRPRNLAKSVTVQ